MYACTRTDSKPESCSIIKRRKINILGPVLRSAEYWTRYSERVKSRILSVEKEFNYSLLILYTFFSHFPMTGNSLEPCLGFPKEVKRVFYNSA